MDASINLYTFKEGLLSKLAHDLRLSVTRFEIEARGTEIRARFEPRSIRVDGVMKDGKLLRDQPSESDREKICDNMLDDVLRASDFGDIKFVGRTASREPPFSVEGELTLCGVTRPLRSVLTLRDSHLVAELELIPSQWGIKPYRALGGTLKVQDRIRVAIRAQADWLREGHELNPAVELVWTFNPTKPSSSRGSVR